MTISKLLIANRGEIAIRIARAASDLGIQSVAVYSEDDTDSLHTKMSDGSHMVPGLGPKAYLDIEEIIKAALETGCNAVHPGYGFLSEKGELAKACLSKDLIFVGPTAEHLDLFGDKGRARRAASDSNVPTLLGFDRAITLSEAEAFLSDLGPEKAMMIKAIAGGGGRGTGVVRSGDDVESVYRRCQSEAETAFGNNEVYVEEYLSNARHIEVQIVGDKHGTIQHLGERECSVQRRYQKVVEVAPAPGLSDGARENVISAALRLAKEVQYSSLGTFEFLVDTHSPSEETRFVFLEANARLQVEHTVTEEVTGVDLVQTQIRIANGASLEDIGITETSSTSKGYAIQCRVNMESLATDGTIKPSFGTISAYEPPNGPGVRTDGFGYAGYKINTSFDSLLAKVITHSPSNEFGDAIRKALRALSEFRLEGLSVNIGLLQAILNHSDFAEGRIHTRWLDENLPALADQGNNEPALNAGAIAQKVSPDSGFAGARVDTNDPMALFNYDAEVKATHDTSTDPGSTALNQGPDGTTALVAPIQGTIVSIDVKDGEEVAKNQPVAVIEAMKMEHVIVAPEAGVVREITMSAGDVVRENHPIVFVEERDDVKGGKAADGGESVDLDFIRPDLQETLKRHALTQDENRPEAVAKRNARGYRMPRENIDQLVDDGSFQEYWPLIVAQQHTRHDINKLRKNTPADGVIAGTASVNGELFDDEMSRTMVVSYDYTVLAGTQGHRGHYKQDRIYEMAGRFKLPLILFSEGGGGRPGDDDTGPRVAADTHTFTQFSQLSGLVPMVGINHGRCFAGNTALLACCDVIIASEDSTIAMGGPAMIEGGGLGVYTPEEVGPMSFQVPNGVVDILVKTEEETVEVAKKYLSYFQGNLQTWEAPDQRALRHIVPENRVRLYDMREIILTLADKDSVLEIREKFGIGIITAFIRIEGKPMGVVANNPHHLAGAIDSDGADKGARFLQLCDAFDIPVLSLMDCPGMMVGPDVEKTALVRHCTRMFNTGANLSTPLFGVIVRKAYGLGVQAMCGASTLVGFFTVAWPTAEFAGMNIEGAVKLGHRKEIAMLENADERKTEFDRRVADAYEDARAINAATGGGIDDVIDPAETRTWIANSLRRLPPIPPREGKKYPYIDTW